MSSRRRIRAVLIVVAVCFFALPLLVLTHAQNSAEPWTAAQTVLPADFAKEPAGAKQAATVLFVGFPRLYTAGHIKGAQYHGAANKPEGLREIKKWAETLPRSTNLVIYCGCCPMEKCPNIRPAFAALREMGFTNLRVLTLPTSFAVDWVGKELPYDRAPSKGQAL
jgi:thiosulfate/3-mercaptopyruvate sulfurtransferase